VLMACTLTHIWMAGELVVGVGVGVGVGVLLGVGVGVAEAVGVAGAEVVGSAVGLEDVALAVGAAAGLLAVAVAVAVAAAGVGVAAAASCTAETESSWASAELIAAEVVAAVAGWVPQVAVAAAVCANCVTCVPARNALTSPDEIIDTPASTVSAEGPTCRALMMAPSSSCSSHPGSRVSSCLT
jgi:hypothetical protein